MTEEKENRSARFQWVPGDIELVATSPGQQPQQAQQVPTKPPPFQLRGGHETWNDKQPPDQP